MRVRATVLLVRHHAVLLVRERGGPWLLPGGLVGLDELPIVAAIRALHEENGVEASAAAFLFQQVSAHYLHHVFRIAIPDDVHPRTAIGAGLDEMVWVGAVPACAFEHYAGYAGDSESRDRARIRDDETGGPSQRHGRRYRQALALTDNRAGPRECARGSLSGLG